MNVTNLALLFLSFASKNEQKFLEPRADLVATSVIEAVDEEGALFGTDNTADDVSKTEKLLTRIVFLESRGNPRALNPDGDAGLAQLRQLWWDGHTRDEVFEPVLNVRLAIRALKSLKASCGGNAQRWLGAYASGKCGGAPMVARIRCAPLGLCEAT